MQKNPDSWQCFTRENIIDTWWYPIFYITIITILFASNHRCYAFMFAIVTIFFVMTTIQGCMSSISALITIAIAHSEAILFYFILTLVSSLFSVTNTTYGIIAVIFYLIIYRRNIVGKI